METEQKAGTAGAPPAEAGQKRRKTRWGSAEEKNAVEESGETSAAQQVASGGPSCSGSSQPGATAAAGGGDGPASSAQPSPSSSVAAAASQSASAPASTSLKLPFNIQAAAAAAREALEKAKKAAELQRQIQEQLRQRQLGGVGAAVPLAAPQPVSAVAAQTAPVTAAASAAAAITGADPLLQQQLLLLQREAQQLQLRKQRELEQEKALLAKARPLRFDRFGREVDAEGRLVEVKPVLHSSLKINQRQRQEKLQQASAAEPEDLSECPWFDPTIVSKTARSQRKRKALEFLPQGHFLRMEEHMKAFQQKQALNARAEGESQGAGDPSEAPENQSVEELFDAAVPELSKIWNAEAPSVEPWDAPLLVKGEGYEINQTTLDSLIEHPAPVVLALDSKSQTIVNMYLTAKERKKLRRRKRQEKEREKQDKIRMGLMPPPPPKVKLSNLMRVLGDSAVADPSKVEKQVRQQMAARLEGHEQRNEERKLTAEERAKKAVNKWRLKQSSTCQVVVFRVKSLLNKRHLFKVDTNAKQFHVTGVCVIAPQPQWSVVVFEGSDRAIKRLRALMLRRIQWMDAEGGAEKHQEEDDDEDGAEVVASDACCLCWQGSDKKPSFSTWRVHRVQSDAEARRIFRNVRVEHYWEAAQKFRDVNVDL